MKTLYLDCSMGAAGDMLSAALFDLVPDPNAAAKELNAFGIPGVSYRFETLTKCGIAAMHMKVLVDGQEEGASQHAHHHHGRHHHEHRSIADIMLLIGRLSLSPDLRADVEQVYMFLAEAESRAHGRDIGEIHFHEVGTMDAIADIAAFCHLLRRLSPDKVVVSPVNVGSGTVECAHGVLPVPAPATSYLLKGMASYSDGTIDGELCTPTGAALLKRFATSFGPQPLMTVESVGYGAGLKDFPRANVLRAVFGVSNSPIASGDEIFELEFNVDDMTGEELSFASERIFDAGARDVSFSPVLMKKGRPGYKAGVMCTAEDREKVVSAIFANTSTLGIRETHCRRYQLERKIETVSVGNGFSARRKISEGYGAHRTKWEADDLAEFARRTGASLSVAKENLDTALTGGKP